MAPATPLASRAARGPAGRATAAMLVAGSLVASSAGCALLPRDEEGPGQAPREEPGPTLASGPPPAGWKDVRSSHGLVYSVPPDWEVGDPYGDPDDTRDSGSDWGSGYVTAANAIADRGYCPSAGLSFRALVGISQNALPGDAREQAESASRAMSDSIDRRFTESGADVPVPDSLATEPALRRFAGDDRLLRDVLCADAFGLSRVFAQRRPDGGVHLDAQYQTGSSLLPTFPVLRVRVGEESGVGVFLPGTPFALAGRLGARRWAQRPVASTRLALVAAVPHRRGEQRGRLVGVPDPRGVSPGEIGGVATRRLPFGRAQILVQPGVVGGPARQWGQQGGQQQQGDAPTPDAPHRHGSYMPPG